MEIDLLSVIVCVYNAEKYLSRCVESILASTYRNLEVILVDDGSSDTSLQICEKYSKLDNRVKVFPKDHSGLTSTRNYGLEKMRGRYLAFADSDDYISPFMYQRLIDTINKENVLVSECNWIEVTERTGAERPGKLKKYGRIPISKAKIGLIVNSRAFGAGYVWNCVFDYKRICELAGRKFSFDPDMKYYDDGYFQISIYLQLPTPSYIFIINDCLYYYVLRQNSLSHNRKNLDDDLKRISDDYKIAALIKDQSSHWNYRRAMGNHLNLKMNLIYHKRNSNREDIWGLWNWKEYFLQGFQMSWVSWRFPAYYFKFWMICLARIKYLYRK